MFDSNNSQSVKAGSITYFFDIKETKQRKPYLVITMSRFMGENEERERVSMPLFPEHVREFTKVFLEMVQDLPEETGYPVEDNHQQPSASQLPLRGVRPQRRSSMSMRRR